MKHLEARIMHIAENNSAIFNFKTVFAQLKSCEASRFSLHVPREIPVELGDTLVITIQRGEWTQPPEETAWAIHGKPPGEEKPA